MRKYAGWLDIVLSPTGLSLVSEPHLQTERPCSLAALEAEEEVLSWQSHQRNQGPHMLSAAFSPSLTQLLPQHHLERQETWLSIQ